ncbi:MAG TPA: ATP-dependent helicase, partial [Negativicutes bacterium]|nr:ATP-dependent helicase [Negativicutes bacterium]
MEKFHMKLADHDKPQAEALEKDMESLNEYQRAAVIDNSRVLLVNAQVGSGKTTVLIHKILYLHFGRGVPFESMVVLTFTNKAALEIKTRIKEKNKDIRDEELRFFGTFHGVCRTLLSSVLPVEKLGYTSSFSIYDAEAMPELYERVMNENKLSLKYRNKLKKRIEQYRQGKLLYGNMKQDDDLADFIRLLASEKKHCNAMEFDDLIENTIELLGGNAFVPEWIIVDEFQDSDERQLELIERMKGERTRIFAVGDPNQVIYTWRGSRRDIFAEFRRKYNGKELALPLNYRSTLTILDAARAFISPGQSIEGTREEGRPIIVKKHYNTFNEALYLCDRINKLVKEGADYRDIAVLYRKQKQSEVFRDVFEKNGIPYELSIKRTLRDIPVLYWTVRLLSAAANPRDRDSLVYVLGDNRYGFGLGRRKLNEILAAVNEGRDTDNVLTKRVIGFREWCESGCARDSASIFDYFDLGTYLIPTSVTYEEDRGRVMELLEGLAVYAAGEEKGYFAGVKDYMSNATLYGSSILGDRSSEGGDSVKLMTLHASKGLEFKFVFISAANLGLIPIPARSPAEEEEEKRLFFVGITRARDYLEISYHTNPDEFGVYGIPSPYLRMIPPELIESEDFVSRGANLSELRREVKALMDSKQVEAEAEEPALVETKNIRVCHDKYGQGVVVDEDDANITVEFEVYGTKLFSKAFCPLKYIEEG